jgi:phospholipase C
MQILEGFRFPAGTLFAKLREAGKEWRIYHDGLPQTAVIDSLRLEYINPLTQHFRNMEHFADDVRSGDLPSYVFIEPDYDTGHNYLGGNSMHPLNDIRKGEELIAEVYRALRNSQYWEKLMLLVVFDEHGGFYDHVPPPRCVPTGDDGRYAHPNRTFQFEYLGVRVPAILASAYTPRGMVIPGPREGGGKPFDHSSIVATVSKRFGLTPLTNRDAAAPTLEVALTLASPRRLPGEAPLSLGTPKPDPWWEPLLEIFRRKPAAAADNEPMSQHQKNFLALALACDLAVSDPKDHPAIRGRRQAIRNQGDATQYIREVERKIHDRRKKK